MVRIDSNEAQIDAIILDNRATVPTGLESGNTALYTTTSGVYILASGSSPVGPLGAGGGGSTVYLEGGLDSNFTITSSDTDQWHGTTHTVAGINDGDNIEVIVNASCYAEEGGGFLNYCYFKIRISLDDGATWTIYDNWARISSFIRLPFALTAFKSGTVDTALKVQLGFREANTTLLEFKACNYSIITKVL